MTSQVEKAHLFRTLHVPGQPLILMNVWDAGSARTVVSAGAQALATGSWSVASALGFSDGEETPLPLALENLTRIVNATGLPVSMDLESGYADVPEQVGETVRQAFQTGAVGCNLEDSFPTDGTMRTRTNQVLRLRQARQAAEQHFFINARTDVFFQGPPNQHDKRGLSETLERARAYADAGADGLFVPGLIDLGLITELTAASPLPVNVLVQPDSPSLDQLAEAGVARLSHGPGPYRLAMKTLEDAARAIYRSR
ncbi:isocitrate lyase/phosphoenolpyruvate mutase family protein (plasmid) [Deinococcus sp. KNUC1210]|uniref:isocitrate lyase/PEP mutase family protein n=1 Tax=Deinococcus sp. KNUC1210 TaxID=2917691 RepID=UPI001EF0B9DB|nr:isocitrate lyase/phosphoenolpyruvate mutase family protein [Deinococcus sp. KNUC1210]ULH13952.1 isocitrate lyase/phosphoenolpyruvate mutase family protein [Deinococcus sp. KNUC1210]